MISKKAAMPYSILAINARFEPIKLFSAMEIILKIIQVNT